MSFNNSGLDSLKLAVIAALFTVLGDLIALILAIIALHQQKEENAKARKELHEKILQLQQELEKFNSKC